MTTEHTIFGSFPRPVGARADLRELAYVSTLLQTGKVLREDATVTATDIRLYLRSRYGLDVPTDDASDIVRGLGGTYGKRKLEEEVAEDIVGEESAPPREGARSVAATREARNPLPEAVEVNTDKALEDEETGHRPKELQGSNPPVVSHEGGHCKNSPQAVEALKRLLPVTSKGQSDNGESLDLVQLVATLLIPTLLRASTEAEELDADESKESQVDAPQEVCQPCSFFERRRRAAERRRDVALKAERESLRPSPRCIILDVLRFMIFKMNGVQALRGGVASGQLGRERKGDDSLPNMRPVVLSEDLVRRLLETFMEVEAAADEGLVRAMVEAAGGEGVPLDEHAFARALTCDVGAWKVGVEDELSETFVDVFGFDPVDANEYLLGRVVAEAAKDAAQEAVDMARDHAANAIDMVAFAHNRITDHIIDFVGGDHPYGENGRLKPVLLEVVSCTKNSVRAEAGKEESTIFGGKFDQCSNEPGAETPGKRIIPTAPYIDYVVDSNRCLIFLVLLWVFFLFCMVILYAVLGGINVKVFDCGKTFGCEIAQQLFRWIVLGILLVAGGTVIITPVSLGNDPYQKTWKPMLLSLFSQLVYCIIPYAVLRHYKRGIPHSADGVLSTIESNMNNYYFEGALDAFLVLGCLLAGRLLLFLAAVMMPKDKVMTWRSLMQRLLIPHNTRLSASTKKAATHKINVLLENAHKLHHLEVRGDIVTDPEENFILNGLSLEGCGGLVWTWRRCWSGDIFKRDGVWIHCRLVVGQAGQLISVMFLTALLIVGTERLAASAEAKRDFLINEPPSHSRDYALWMTPEGSIIKLSSLIGGFVALVIAIALILLYLPSTVSTVLKLRSGAIPSLKDPTFLYCRSQADTIFYNVGNLIYALIGSASLFFFIFAGGLFLFLWPPTQQTLKMILAWCIGLGLTILLKKLFMTVTRGEFHVALFRKRPRAANFNALAMECWNIGLGGGILLSRIIQFLFAACFWIGRIDVAFLDEGVKVFGYQFDYAPKYFRTEILVHEAHRHPFVDRLGGMFLMRIKHGKQFSSNAGVFWRILFVLALMPWLLKFRQADGHDAGEGNRIGSFLVGLSESLTDKKGSIAASCLPEEVAQRARGHPAVNALITDIKKAL